MNPERELREALDTVREQERQIKELTRIVNSQKRRIDRLVTKLMEKDDDKT